VETLAYVAPWVLASVSIGMVVGIALGRGRGRTRTNQAIEREQKAMCKMLVDLLQSAEHLNSNVASHNSEMQEKALQVQNLEVTGEMEAIKQTLLGHMTTLLESNTALHQDLLCTQYRLEEQAQEIDAVRREARTDDLTNVANRKAFDEKLHLLLDDWKRKNDPFVLQLLDLDHFKRINDSHGHPAGDRTLKMVGQWLKQWVREGDFVSRFGGDEFVVLLPQTELSVGIERAEYIRAKAAETASRTTSRGEHIAISLSIGVVQAAKTDDAESVLQRADQALYRSKQRGRNQVQCEKPEQSISNSPVLA